MKSFICFSFSFFSLLILQNNITFEHFYFHVYTNLGFFSMLSAVLVIFLKIILTRNSNAGIWFLVLFIKSQRSPQLKSTYWFPCNSDQFATPIWAVSLRNGSHPEQNYIYWSQSFMCTTEENIFSVGNYFLLQLWMLTCRNFWNHLRTWSFPLTPHFFPPETTWAKFILSHLSK